jgi:single-stranded DNA-binding protein
MAKNSYKDLMMPQQYYIGRLIRDPELKEVGKHNTAACEYTIVWNEYNFEKEEAEGVFIKVTSWKDQAERDNKNLEKGAIVAVQGNLKGSQGDDKVFWSVSANRVQYVKWGDDISQNRSDEDEADEKPRRGSGRSEPSSRGKREPEPETETVDVGADLSEIDDFLN